MLFQLEALAVSALDLCGIGLVGADGDAVQAAVVLILAVVGTVVDGALDALVGSAGTAAVGTIIGHGEIPPVLERSCGFRRTLFCTAAARIYIALKLKEPALSGARGKYFQKNQKNYGRLPVGSELPPDRANTLERFAYHR